MFRAPGFDIGCALIQWKQTQLLAWGASFIWRWLSYSAYDARMVNMTVEKPYYQASGAPWLTTYQTSVFETLCYYRGLLVGSKLLDLVGEGNGRCKNTRMFNLNDISTSHLLATSLYNSHISVISRISCELLRHLASNVGCIFWLFLVALHLFRLSSTFHICQRTTITITIHHHVPPGSVKSVIMPLLVVAFSFDPKMNSKVGGALLDMMNNEQNLSKSTETRFTVKTCKKRDLPAQVYK